MIQFKAKETQPLFITPQYVQGPAEEIEELQRCRNTLPTALLKRALMKIYEQCPLNPSLI
jgi:hypothetical protein